MSVDLDQLVDAELGRVGRWAEELDGLADLIGARFARSEPRVMAVDYVKALLADLQTRNGWTIAEASGRSTPDGPQRLLAKAVWDEDGVREDLRGRITEHLGEMGGTLVFDETGDIKQGRMTVGVARQYTGVTGQVENCQVAVFAAYVSTRGQALVDTELYLPKAFVTDQERCRQAKVPEQRAGSVVAKGDLAVVMLARALEAGMPFDYVAGDEVYGRSANLRAAIEAAGKGYVLEVPCDHRVSRHPGDGVRADAARFAVPVRAWQRRGEGAGAKGLRQHAWAWLALDSSGCPPGWRRSLLIRRDRDADVEHAYFLCYHKASATLGELVTHASRRWGIEECFATAKSEAGLDQHQVRLWRSWYRHAILSMLAAGLLAVLRAVLPANLGVWTTA